MFTTRPQLVGTFGMAASTHWLASTTGMGVLERGGNAFDAAVAMAFVLHVAEPHMCGPGGDVPVLFARPDGDVHVLCGQGPAPAGATIAHYRSEGLDLVPPTGLLAAVVPGAVPAWLTLLADHGTWRLRDVLEAAVGYAEHGVPVHEAVSDTIAAVRRRFLRSWPTSAATWLVDGQAPRPGSLLRNPVLAATWRRLVLEAEAAGPDRDVQIHAALDQWRSGFVAEAMAAFAARPADDGAGRNYAGVLRGDDLAAWSPGYEAPVCLDVGGVEVNKCGPWSQGPVALQALALLDGMDVDVDPTSAAFVHVVTEAMKLAYADREAFYGDPDHTPVPLDVLLSPAYNAQRRLLIGAEASDEFRPGHIDGFGGPVDYAAAVARGQRSGAPVEPTAAAGASSASASMAGPMTGDTVHLDVVDRWGNMVSATPSGGWLQASPVIDGLGFALGTRAQMFWLEEGHPSSLAPGRRPRTTLTPSLARRDGQPWMAYGTPGGDGQDQWQLGFLLRVLGGMDLQAAIDAPAFHSDHMPSSFWPRDARPGRLVIEERFGPEVAADLRGRGHDVVVGPPWSEGRVSAVTRDIDDEGRAVLRAGANPRGMSGYAVGR